MKGIKHHYKGLLGAALLTIPMFLISCSGEGPMPDTPNPGDRSTVIRLTVGMRNSTRATDDGEGHPFEGGVRNEDKIHDLTLFFYTGNGPDSNANVMHAEYAVPNLYEQGNGFIRYVIPVHGFEPKVGDRVLAVANMGNLSHLGTLAQVRDHTAQAWKGDDVASADYFAMSSSSKTDGIIMNAYPQSPEPLGSAANPFSLEIELERLAARIDLWFDEENINTEGVGDSKPSLSYNASAGEGRVHVLNAVPVNVMRQPTYVIKHVDSNGFVTEPTTLLKGNTDRNLKAWFGNSRSSVLADPAHYDELASNYTLASMLAKGNIRQLTGAESSDHKYAMTVCYANENTYAPEFANQSNVTGLLLRALYVPKEDAETKAPFTAGETFWRCRSVSNDENDSRYFKNRESAENFVNRHAGYLAPVEYRNGICYYSVWLRHLTANQSEVEFPMKYATVRNHIYRLALGFRGPGTDTPVFEDPDDRVGDIIVRPWHFHRLEEIIM